MFAHNQCFNILLNQSIQQFEDNLLRKTLNEFPEYISATEQDFLVKKILKDRNIQFNTKVLQQCRQNFNKDIQKTIKTFQKGSKSDNGMLKFKQSKNLNGSSFETTQEQYKIKETNNPKYKILRLFNQSFKIRWTKEFNNSRNIKFFFKSITISMKNDNFYISFNIEKHFKSSKLFHKNNGNIKNLENKQLKRLKSASIDININNIDLLVISKKKHTKISLKSIKDDNLNKKLKSKLDYLQQLNSKRIEKLKKTKKKLSKNFKKVQKKINKIKEKNKNKKTYNLHKIVNSIIQELKDNSINHLVVEDLNVKAMTIKTTNNNKIKLLGKEKTKSMKKNILQISFGLLINILKYKCADNEIYFELINPTNTSKDCCKCGTTNKNLQLKDRIYECINPNCNNQIDRDLNSCFNIYNKSIKLG